jgi:hypothetical protein
MAAVARHADDMQITGTDSIIDESPPSHPVR